jgi:uncharacterized protein DUF3309
MLGTLLFILLIVLLLGAVPAWPYSREWGYGPSSILLVLLVVLLVLMFMGTVPWPWGTPTGPVVVP